MPPRKQSLMVLMQGAVWKVRRQTSQDMVLAERPLSSEAAMCITVLAPAAKHPNSPALLQAYLEICSACQDWQTAVILLRCFPRILSSPRHALTRDQCCLADSLIEDDTYHILPAACQRIGFGAWIRAHLKLCPCCRKHTLKGFCGNAASLQAFETAFGTLTAAGQSSTQVELFRFAQQQGVLRTRPANLKLAGVRESTRICTKQSHPDNVTTCNSAQPDTICMVMPAL